MNINNSNVDCQQRGGVIYKITNLLNGKAYVGQTIQNLNKRLSRHRNDDRPGISQAIKKYGWENFSVEVLEECENREQLNEREIFWIAKLNTKTPNGYNLTIGGKGGGEHIVTDEMRKKLSESHMGYKVKEETKAKISATMKAKGIKPPSWKGRHHTEKSLKKISAINKGKSCPPKVCAKISASLKKYYSEKKKLEENKFIEGSLFE